MSEGNGTQRELGQIQATLISIQQQMAEANDGRRRLHDKLDATRDELRDVKGDVAAVKKAVDEMAPAVADYQATKAKGIGILIGVAAAGGTVGAGVKALLSKIGIGS